MSIKNDQVMKAVLIFVLLLFNFYVCHSQEKVKGYIDVSQNLHSIIYTETNISFGINFPLETGSISLFGNYEYGGNWKIHSPYADRIVPAYKLDYHFLGGGVKYRILKKSKFYSPTIQLTALTEIVSHYRGNYIVRSDFNSEGFFFQPTNYYSEPYVYGYPKGYIKEIFYYVSTPFIGSILIGNEFKIYKELNVNLGIGFSMRGVKVRYKSWNTYESEPKADISNPYSLEGISWLKILDLSFGLNYTFSFKKKPKIETP